MVACDEGPLTRSAEPSSDRMFGNPVAQAVDEDTWVPMEVAWRTHEDELMERDRGASIEISNERPDAASAACARTGSE
jgi:hypothetical protein